MGKKPAFRIRKKLFSREWYVIWVRGFLRRTKVASFKSEFDAKYWIKDRGPAWLERRKARRNRAPAPDIKV